MQVERQEICPIQLDFMQLPIRLPGIKATLERPLRDHRVVFLLPDLTHDSRIRMARPLGVGGQETIVRGRTCEAVEREAFQPCEFSDCLDQVIERVVAQGGSGQDQFEVLKFEQARDSECSEVGEPWDEVDSERF